MVDRSVVFLLAAVALGGCAGDRTARGADPAPGDGASADTPQAAIDACRADLEGATGGPVEVVRTGVAHGNPAVYMVAGADRTHWRCLVSGAGFIAEIKQTSD